jgi:hypothetical protein
VTGASRVGKPPGIVKTAEFVPVLTVSTLVAVVTLDESTTDGGLKLQET